MVELFRSSAPLRHGSNLIYRCWRSVASKFQPNHQCSATHGHGQKQTWFYSLIVSSLTSKKWSFLPPPPYSTLPYTVGWFIFVLSVCNAFSFLPTKLFIHIIKAVKQLVLIRHALNTFFILGNSTKGSFLTSTWLTSAKHMSENMAVIDLETFWSTL